MTSRIGRFARATLFVFAATTFTAYSQPHYTEVGALPTPEAVERGEVFDPESKTIFSFIYWTRAGAGGNSSDVYTANADALNWVKTTSFPTQNYWGRGCASDGKLYFNGTIDSATVSRFAPIGADGLLGNWQDTAPLPSVNGRRSLHQTFVFGNRLYVVGGWHLDGQPAYSDVWFAPIQSGGGLGSFVQTTSLPTSVVSHSVVVAPSGSVYVVNGTNIFTSQIDADGSIGAWRTEPLITGLNHNNNGNSGVALLPSRLVIVDASRTFVCRLDNSGQVTTLEATIPNPATFNQRSAFTIDGKVFVAATTGKLYRIDGIAPNTTWDDFTGGLGTFYLTPDWSLETSAAGAPLLAANTQADRFAWKTNISLATSWAVETTVQLSNLFNDGGTTGTAGFALGGTNLNLLALADVIYSRDGWIYPGLGYWTGVWNDSLTNHPWVPGATNTLTLRLERQPGRNNLVYTITSPSGLRVQYVSKDISDAIWSQIQRIGFRAFKVNAAFSYLSVEMPLPPTTEIALYPGVTLRGEPGTNYRIEYTTPLAPAQWIAVTNVTLNAPTLLWFDSTPANREQRFYRAVQQP